jgi:hypothetical protein
MEVVRCSICSKIIKEIESNNAWPVRAYSSIGEKENRCCHECNNGIVLPIRIGLIRATAEEVEELHKKFNKMDYYELTNLVAETGLPTIE